MRTWLIVGLTSFVMIGLLMLLVFQTIFLDDLYRFSKIRTVKNAALEIAQAYEEDAFTEYAEYWNAKEECVIYVVDEKGFVVASRGADIGLERLTQGELCAYYNLAMTSEDGTVFSEVKIDLMDREKLPPPKEKQLSPKEKSEEPQERLRFAHPETSDRVLYALLTSPQEEPPMLVLVTTVITPVDATLRVLQVQLLIAMVVFVIVTALLAWFMAKSIAAPIERINLAAKGLADGTYQPPVEGSYREIVELRDTLTAIDGDLRKSEQLQRDLIANVSHDLRTPLTMIIGYSEAIRDLPGEDSAENIQVVIEEAERLTRLTNDVLDLSKLQAGVEPFDMAPTKLTEILRDVVARLGRMTEPDGYTITLTAEDEITVSADEVRLSQIIYNLLNNALAHTGDDKCVIVQQTVNGNSVRISFTDSGKGIPADELSNIWLRYYQVHSHEHRRETMNSGLGLSIVQALVHRHGGTCGVYSTVGTGSTFWFELPIIGA